MHASLILVSALRLHLHLHLIKHPGPAIDYVAITAAAFASFAGLPGPGEPVLIAAGVFAAKHKLDITPVLFWAWAGATAGGLVGWLAGRAGGRGVLTAPGPLYGLRLRTVARGDQLFRRFPVIAILLTPPWIAGIHRVDTSVYLITNVLSAVVWAVGIGLGAFYVGPPVLDWVQDAGWISVVGIGLLVAAGIWFEVARRRRLRRRR